MGNKKNRDKEKNKKGEKKKETKELAEKQSHRKFGSTIEKKRILANRKVNSKSTTTTREFA